LDVPVALLVFNRPEETARVFAEVRAARPRRLLVVADGPRPGHPNDAERCAATRSVTELVDWDCDVERLYADENMGCRDRVASGLDWVFARAEEAIVLEDDCLPHPTFFPFAAAMLERYRDDERVHMIAGTNYFSDPARTDTYFFSRYFAIWGWASWARAWRSYDVTMAGWPRVRADGVLEALFGEPGLAGYLTDAFDLVHRGEVDTWDLQWFYAGVVSHGLSVVPAVNLVSNIGFSGTRVPGSNLGMATHPVSVDTLHHPETFVPDVVYERRLYRERLGPPPKPARARLRDLAARARSLADRS
jgi:hypothetical protein